MIETIASIPVVLGLIEVLKTLGLPSKYAPLASVILGIAIAFLSGGVTTVTTLAGITYGLSASGLYSGAKTIIPTKPSEETP